MAFDFLDDLDSPIPMESNYWKNLDDKQRRKEFEIRERVGTVAPEKDGILTELKQGAHGAALDTLRGIGSTLEETTGYSGMREYFDEVKARNRHLDPYEGYKAASLDPTNIARTIGSGAAQSALSLGAGMATTALTGNVVAGGAVMTGTMFMQLYGDRVKDYRERMPEQDEGTVKGLAFASAVGESLIESVCGPEAAFNGIAKRLVTGALKDTTKSFVKHVGKEATKNFIMEGSEELVQDMWDRVCLRAGTENVTLPSWDEVKETFMGGAWSGLALGGIGGAVENIASRKGNTQAGIASALPAAEKSAAQAEGMKSEETATVEPSAGSVPVTETETVNPTPETETFNPEEAKSTSARLAEEVAKEFGLKVRYFDEEGAPSPVDDKGNPVNGWYDEKTNEYWIDRNDPEMNPLETLGHEFKHFLDQNHSDLVKTFDELLKSGMNDAGKQALSETETDYRQDGYPAGQGEIEFSADTFGKMWTDPEFWRDVANRAEKLNAGMGQRMLDALKEFIKIVRAKLKNIGTPEAKELFDNMGELRSEAARIMAEIKRRNGTSTEAENVVGVKGSDMVQSIPVDDLNIDPARFQFKSKADPVTGVDPNTPVGGEWNPVAAGNLYVWEDKTGKKFVVNGHHRFQLAKEKNVESVNAIVDREADGITAEQARRNGIIVNILDGQGDVEDYAEFIRKENIGEEEALNRGIIQEEKGKQKPAKNREKAYHGFLIGRYAMDNLYRQFRDGDISAAKAAIIADVARKDDGLEAAGIRAAKTMPNAQLREFLKCLKNMPREKTEQGDLFGFDDSALQTAEKLAKLAARHIREIGDKLKAVRQAVKNPETAAKGDVKVGKNAQKIFDQTLRDQLEWEHWYTNPELSAQLRKEAGIEETPEAPAVKENLTTENAEKAEEPVVKENLTTDGRFNMDSDTPLLTPEEDSRDFQLFDETPEEARSSEAKAERDEAARLERAKEEARRNAPDLPMDTDTNTQTGEVPTNYKTFDKDENWKLDRTLGELQDAYIAALNAGRHIRVETPKGNAHIMKDGDGFHVEGVDGKSRHWGDSGVRDMLARFITSPNPRVKIAEESPSEHFADRKIQKDGSLLRVGDYAAFGKTKEHPALYTGTVVSIGSKNVKLKTQSQMYGEQVITLPWSDYKAHYPQSAVKITGEELDRFQNEHGGSTPEQFDQGKISFMEQRLYREGNEEREITSEAGERADARTKREVENFVGDGRMYSLKRTKEISNMAPTEISAEQEKQIREAYDYVMNGEPVARLTGQEFQKDGTPLTEKVTRFYQEQYNGKAVHPELGEVKLDLEGVKDSLGHGIGSVKAAAYAAVPQMIENGKIFDRQKNWKGRGYDTVVMAAPLEIGGVPYVGEVVVKQGADRQGFYLHEVEVKEKLADVFKTANGSTSPVPRLIISHFIEKIKAKKDGKANFSENEAGKDYSLKRKKVNPVKEAGTFADQVQRDLDEQQAHFAETQSMSNEKATEAAEEWIKQQGGYEKAIRYVARGRTLPQGSVRTEIMYLIHNSPEFKALPRETQKHFTQAHGEHTSYLGQELQALRNDALTLDTVEKVNARIQKYTEALGDTEYQELRNIIKEKTGTDIADLPPEIIHDKHKLDQVLRETLTRSLPFFQSIPDRLSEIWINFLLSGLRTHTKNTAGNLLNAAYELGPKRFTEAAINLIARKKDAATFGEYKELFKHIDWKSAWEGAKESFDLEVLDPEGKLDSITPTIPGKAGRVIRTPGRFLKAADRFAKEILIPIEATSHAYREGKANGLSGERLKNFITAQLADKNSKANEYGKGQADKFTFTDKVPEGRIDGRILNYILQLKNMGGIQGSLAKGFFPFVGSPYNILRQGVRKSPLGLVNLAIQTGKGFAKKRQFDNEYIQHAAEQVLVWGMTGILYSMFGSGDGDDEPPVITGSGGKRGSNERNFNMQNLPANSIRIGDKWYDYSGLEPLSHVLNALGNTLEAFQSGDPKRYQKAFTKTVESLADKDYFQTFKEIFNLLQADEYTIKNTGANYISSWIPNFVRQFALYHDDNIAEQRGADFLDLVTTRSGFRTLAPKVDYFGRDIPRDIQESTGGSWLWRFAPWTERDVNYGDEADELLRNYNYQHKDNPYFVSGVARKGKVNDRKIVFSGETYHDLCREAGELAHRKILEGIRRGFLHVGNPTEKDIELVKKVFERAKKETRAKFIRAGRFEFED